MSKAVPRALRDALIALHGKACCMCGRETVLQEGREGIDPDEYNSVRCTVDHIVSRVDGGSDGLDNLQILCGECNREKGQ